MSSATGNGWAQLRQQTRTLESQVHHFYAFPKCFCLGSNTVQTEGYFHKYSQFSQATTVPPKPTDDEQQTEAAIQDLLEKVRSSLPSI